MKNTGLLLAVAGTALISGAAHAGKAAKPLTCPVMKSPVKDRAHAPFLVVNNQPVYFCCPGCSGSLKKAPAKYLKTPIKDPVSGKPFKVTAKTPKMEHHGALFLFSSSKTHHIFHADPDRYTKHDLHHGSNHAK